jgi:hypothetical protein
MSKLLSPWISSPLDLFNGRDKAYCRELNGASGGWERFDLMLTIARTLSKEFDYVRVDLYNCSDKVYFGELTLRHGGGWERFDPASWDLYVGNKLDLARA